MTEVCVVIPMYDKAEYTRKCMALTKSCAGMPVDIVIVDDGSIEPFVDVRPGVYVITLPQNTGFTNAANTGILYAVRKGYKYVHLLNNDTEPQKDFIKLLYDVMEKEPSVGIASSVRIYDKPDGQQIELYGVDLIRGYQAVTTPDNLHGEVVECNWVPLCSSLMRVSMIEYLGLLDHSMRTHSSDLDYCLRAKMSHYVIVIVTDSRVFHHHEVTTKANKITPEKDQRRLLEKLAGLDYAQFMQIMPLDADAKTYGKLEFTVYQK